jgi:hypothetical protein
MWAQTVMTCGSAGRSKAGQASETGGPRLEPAQWAQAGGAIRPVGAAPCRIKQRIAELCATPPSRFVRIPRNPTTHTDGIRPPTESDHLLLCPRHLRSRRRVGEPQPLSRSGRCFRLSPLGGLWFICLPERGGGRQLSERWSVDIGMGADLEPARAQGPSVGEPQDAIREDAIELRRVEVLPEPGHELEPLAEGVPDCVNRDLLADAIRTLAVSRRVG